MQGPWKDRPGFIEYPARFIVKLPPSTGFTIDLRHEERSREEAELRIIAKARWAQITAPVYQYELAFPGRVAVSIRCFDCGKSEFEIYCYAYLDRFVCEDCCSRGGW